MPRSLVCDAVLVVAGLVTQEVPYNEVYQRCLDAMKQLAPVAAKAKVKIGCENCNSEQRFLMSPREFWTFLNEVEPAPSSAFTLTLEIFTTQDSPSSGLRCTDRASRASTSRTSRSSAGAAATSVYTNLFIGDNNWPAIRAALTKVGYDGWLVPEMEARYRYAQGPAVL